MLTHEKRHFKDFILTNNNKSKSIVPWNFKISNNSFFYCLKSSFELKDFLFIILRILELETTKLMC